MPLFYFRPFNFHPKRQPKIVDIPTSDIALWVVIGLIGAALFVVFVVVPAMLYLNEALPGS